MVPKSIRHVTELEHGAGAEFSSRVR
jgi:hypothetical protein